MSGFYNQQLETQLTGVKPERPTSGRKVNNSLIQKIVMNLNYDDMEKSYKDVL